MFEIDIFLTKRIRDLWRRQHGPFGLGLAYWIKVHSFLVNWITRNPVNWIADRFLYSFLSCQLSRSLWFFDKIQKKSNLTRSEYSLGSFYYTSLSVMHLWPRTFGSFNDKFPQLILQPRSFCSEGEKYFHWTWFILRQSKWTVANFEKKCSSQFIKVSRSFFTLSLFCIVNFLYCQFDFGKIQRKISSDSLGVQGYFYYTSQ